MDAQQIGSAYLAGDVARPAAGPAVAAGTWFRSWAHKFAPILAVGFVIGGLTQLVSAPALQIACSGSATSGIKAELILGRNIGAQVGVSEDAFAEFLNAEVTSRFPDGFSVLDAAGQWRDAKVDKIVREPAKALLIVVRDTGESRSRLKAVADAYKIRFAQQSVLMLTTPACFAF